MTEEEHSLPTEPRPEAPPINQRILFEWDGMLHRALDHFWDKMQVNAANSKPPRIHVYERTLSVIAFGLSVASLVSVWWCMQDATKDRQWYDREISRLVHEVNVRDVLLQDHDALMIREGLKQPGDVMKGPTGNIEYQPRK